MTSAAAKVTPLRARSSCCGSFLVFALCFFIISSFVGYAAFTTHFNETQQEEILENFYDKVHQYADVYHDSMIGRSISAAVCGERTANCERLRNDSDRLKFEVLSLQQELRDKEKQVVALKQTISSLSEKLGLAGSRLKGKSH